MRTKFEITAWIGQRLVMAWLMRAFINAGAIAAERQAYLSPTATTAWPLCMDRLAHGRCRRPSAPSPW